MLTVKNYLYRLKLFFSWLPVTVEAASVTEVNGYIDYMLDKKMAPRPINCHLSTVRGFYNFLPYEEDKIYQIHRLFISDFDFSGRGSPRSILYFEKIQK